MKKLLIASLLAVVSATGHAAISGEYVCDAAVFENWKQHEEYKPVKVLEKSHRIKASAGLLAIRKESEKYWINGERLGRNTDPKIFFSEGPTIFGDEQTLGMSSLENGKPIFGYADIETGKGLEFNNCQRVGKPGSKL